MQRDGVTENVRGQKKQEYGKPQMREKTGMFGKCH